MPNFTTPNSENDVPLIENQRELARKYALDLSTLDYAYPGGEIRSVAFSPKTQKWYGWSHRAIFGFGVGHVVRKGDVIAKGTAADLRTPPSSFPVGFRAKTLADAKRMAQAFSNEVS